MVSVQFFHLFFVGGFPGGMPGNFPGGMPGMAGLPGLNEILSDPEVLAAMQVRQKNIVELYITKVFLS